MNKALNKNTSVLRKENIPNMLIIFRIILSVAIIVLLLIPNVNNLGVSEYWGDPIYRFKSIFHPDEEILGQPYWYTNVYLNEIIAGSLFVLACFTDWLDGTIARSKGWVSDFGKLWDPIADKILINSVLICFAYWEMIPAFIPIIMIIRDTIVDANRMVAAKKNIVVAANWCGKLKTIAQMVACVVIFFFLNRRYGWLTNEAVLAFVDDRPLWWGIQNLAMYLAAALSILSGIIYLVDIGKQTRAKRK